MKSDTIWNPLYVQLLIFELLSQLGMALVNPVASNFAVAMGATVAAGGFLAGLNPLTSLICRPFGGLFLKLAPRKTLLLTASIVFTASSLICAAFPSELTLGASRILLGVAYVIKSAIVVALGASLVPRSQVGQGVAIMGLANIVANALGPSIASVVGLNLGYRFDFVLSGVLYAVSIALLVTLKLPASDIDPKSFAEGKASFFLKLAELRKGGIIALTYPKALPFMCLAAFISYLYGTVTMMLLLTGEERGIENISLFFIVYAVVSCAARPFAGKLNDRYGLRKTLYPEAVLMCISCLIMAFSHTLTGFLVAAAFFALGQGCLFPSLQAASVRSADEEHASLAVNTFFFGPDIGMALGPIASGAVLGAFGSTAMFLVCFAISIAFIVFFFVYDHRNKKQSAR